MQLANVSGIPAEITLIESLCLSRQVRVEIYRAGSFNAMANPSLLIINDGQNMEEMGFAVILEKFLADHSNINLICVAVHAGPERKREYGIASQPDYKGRGDKAAHYHQFILKELLPYIQTRYSIPGFSEKVAAGFSLGALSALDMAWHYPGVFNRVGIFSGSLWWRSIGQEEEEYDDHKHRIMHQEIRKGQHIPGLKFYFQCGNMDETRDRNKNGIIDSIDDTLDLIHELETKGYVAGRDISYTELKDGHHDIPTWGKAMPEFLEWAFGK